MKKPIIGFENENTIKKELKIEDFVEYGIPIEFMGRVDTIVKINNFGFEELKNILDYSEISPLKIYLEALKKQDIEVSITEEDKIMMINKALEYKTGARALKNVVGEYCEQYLYHMLDQGNSYTLKKN